MNKYVYLFSEGNKDMRDLLGGKGANLAEMTNIGLPVPRGFTITTEACNKYYSDGNKISEEVVNQIFEKVAELENITGKKFGNQENPLLVSVRSGARASMPGMMDTVLNLGLNDSVAQSFSKITNNPRFVYDSYRRFIQMFADVVMGFPKSSFERLFDKIKEEKNVKLDTELTADDLIEVVNKDSVMHVGKLWVAIIKYILPCVIFIVWTFGIIDLIKTGGFLELAVDVVITLSILIASVMLTKFEDYK